LFWYNIAYAVNASEISDVSSNNRPVPCYTIYLKNKQETDAIYYINSYLFTVFSLVLWKWRYQVLSKFWKLLKPKM
jgi:hypothetical protein